MMKILHLPKITRDSQKLEENLTLAAFVGFLENIFICVCVFKRLAEKCCLLKMQNFCYSWYRIVHIRFLALMKGKNVK